MTAKTRSILLKIPKAVRYLGHTRSREVIAETFEPYRKILHAGQCAKEGKL
jgi:hypothetical protein